MDFDWPMVVRGVNPEILVSLAGGNTFYINKNVINPNFCSLKTIVP